MKYESDQKDCLLNGYRDEYVIFYFRLWYPASSFQCPLHPGISGSKGIINRVEETTFGSLGGM